MACASRFGDAFRRMAVADHRLAVKSPKPQVSGDLAQIRLCFLNRTHLALPWIDASEGVREGHPDQQ